MRVKTEWVIEKDERTQNNVPRKIGLAPVMKDGVEYEFDVCGDMDQENNLVITKSRCRKLTGAVYSKPGREVAEILREWLNSPIPAAAPQPAAPAEPEKRWKTRGEMRRAFYVVREQLGERLYLDKLNAFGVKDPDEFLRLPAGTAETCYDQLVTLTQRKEVA